MTTDERLQRLERANRRLTLAVIGLTSLAVTAVATGMAANTAQEIKARRFVVVDANGRTVAVLGMDETQPNAGPSLTLYDKNGKPRAALRVTATGSTLAMHDKNRNLRAALVSMDDGALLAMYDENDKIRANMTGVSRSPGFSIFDENGKVRALLSAISGSPSLTIYDENRKELFVAPR